MISKYSNAQSNTELPHSTKRTNHTHLCPRILNKITVGELGNLRFGHLSLLLVETIKPSEYYIVSLSQNLLIRFLCVAAIASSQAIPKQKRTH